MEEILNKLWELRKGILFTGVRTKYGYSIELRMCLIDFKQKLTENQINRLLTLINSRSENNLLLVANVLLKIVESGSINEGDTIT